MSYPTSEDWKNLLQSIIENKESIKEMRLSQKEAQKEVWAQIKEQGKQIGGIGEKFGYFTEGMALPSMEKILRNKFKMEVISPRVLVRDKNTGEDREIDVLAYANSNVNQVFVVEIKSKLIMKGIKQVKDPLKSFFKIFPEHKGKKLFGIIATVDSNPRSEVKAKVLEEGLYYAEISDETFKLKIPKGFQAKAWE